MSVWTMDNCRGAGGYLPPAQRELLDATWSYNWSPGGTGDPTWVDMVKLDGSQAWVTNDVLQRMARHNKSGYVLLGNEPELTGMGMGAYCNRVWRAMQTIRVVRPDLKFVVGGWLAWSPKMGDGSSWPTAFRRAWKRAGRPAALVSGIHFHSYKWKGRSLKADTQKFIDVARVAWPGRELWVTECGSLEGKEQASAAMTEFSTALAGVNRFAFFLSYEDRWAFTSLLTADGTLTVLGRQYRNKGMV